MARRRKRPERTCITGCGTTIDPWKRLCDRCFKDLPYDRRREIAAARQRQGVHAMIDLYRDAAAWLVERRLKLAEEG